MTQSARVIAVHRERYTLLSTNNTIIYGKLKRSAYLAKDALYPTVGDVVLILFNPLGDSQIIETQKRHTFFARHDSFSSRSVQAVAANFDIVFIVTSLNADFNEKRLMRYLVLTKKSGAKPVILLTKCDLCPNQAPFIAMARRAAGENVPIHPVSAITGENMDVLAEYLTKDTTVVLLGSSGTGKSSIINALMGEKTMNTSDIREDDAKGHHTTTHRQLLSLINGSYLIDTPGMRELGLLDVVAEVKETFEDIYTLSAQCRFSDCSHLHEPGCKVQEAVATGTLHPKRLEQFIKLNHESRTMSQKLKKRK